MSALICASHCSYLNDPVDSERAVCTKKPSVHLAMETREGVVALDGKKALQRKSQKQPCDMEHVRVLRLGRVCMI